MPQAQPATEALREGMQVASSAWSSEVPRLSPSLVPLETEQTREPEGEVNHADR